MHVFSLKVVSRQKELGDKVSRKIRKVKKTKVAKKMSDEDTDVEEVCARLRIRSRLDNPLNFLGKPLRKILF